MKNMKTAFRLLRAILSILLFTSAPLISANNAFAKNVSGEYVVVWKGKAAKSRVARSNAIEGLFNRFGQKGFVSVRSIEGSSKLSVVHLQDAWTQKILADLHVHPQIELIEPNFIYEIPEGPNWRTFGADDSESSDSNENEQNLNNVGGQDLLKQLWGISRESGSQFGLSMENFWEKGIVGNKDLKIGVVDTGIKWNHPDLVQNLYTNPGEAGALATNGIDDDGNGFIDDVHGWNFVNNTNNSQDDIGHGTHVSGTIGAYNPNGTGIRGIMQNVSLVPLKFLAAKGGTLEAAINAIDYGTKIGCRILSNSWGGGERSQILEDKIQEAGMRGVLFVAAAGNDYSDNTSDWFGRKAYPGSYPEANIVSVAAIKRNGKFAGFSNWGKDHVHVAAPGVDILSTSMNGGYETMSGTSMATPHVAGLAGLIYSMNPGITPQEAKKILMENTDQVPAWIKRIISGRMNGAKLLQSLSK